MLTNRYRPHPFFEIVSSAASNDENHYSGGRFRIGLLLSMYARMVRLFAH